MCSARQPCIFPNPLLCSLFLTSLQHPLARGYGIVRRLFEGFDIDPNFPSITGLEQSSISYLILMTLEVGLF